MTSEPSKTAREHWEKRLFVAGRELKAGERSRIRVAYYGNKVRGYIMQVADRVFDRELNTRLAPGALLDHFHPDHTVYEASGWTYLPRVLRPWNVGPDDVFADLGCGRGRILFLACRYYPFKRVIGVDVSAELVEHARGIVERRRASLRCQDVEVVHSNARDWVVPDDVTIVYLYFPFSGETLRTVVANLVASLDRNPRRLRILYAAPKQTDALLDTGRFRLVRTSRTPGDYVLARIAVYESIVDADVATRQTAAIRRHVTAARAAGRELRRVRRIMREGGLNAALGNVRPLPVDRGRGRTVSRTLWALNASCLEIALILQAWHAETGDPRDVIIGVTGLGDEFGAHAWLDGLEEDSEAEFHELVRLPPPPAAS